MTFHHYPRYVARKLITGLPKKLQRRLFGSYWAKRSPDRVFLVTHILPAIAKEKGTILWIGCERYTKGYPERLERYGGTCWTLEIQPAQKKWGHPTRHVVGDVRKIQNLFPGISFDAILCNGIFGFGINDAKEQEDTLLAIAEKLTPTGRLVLSWNSDRTSDPVAAGITSVFEYTALAGKKDRYAVEGTTHVYEFLRKR